MSQKRTEGSLVEELPRLLAERGLSMRRLALMTGIHQSHLSRMLRRDPRRPPTAAVAERVSDALGLPPDYFPEVREAFVIQRIQHDPALRESLYRRLKTPAD